MKSDQGEENLSDYQGLLEFLNHNSQLYSSGVTTGSIIVVDDQFVNQQGIRLNFIDIGITDRLKIFSEGGEVIEHFNKLFEEIEKPGDKSALSE